MAEIHAIQNGNWSDTSTWDLGRVPEVDDDVDLLNYQINLSGLQEIHAKNISNSLGGYFINANNVHINSDITIISSYILGTNSNNMFINGDILLVNSGSLGNFGITSACTYLINGNITFENTYSGVGVLPMPYYTSGNHIINGNIISHSSSPCFFGATGILELIINGNIDIAGTLFTGQIGSKITFNGNVKLGSVLNSGLVQASAVFQFNGTLLQYKSKTYPVLFNGYGTDGIITNDSLRIINLEETSTFTLFNIIAYNDSLPNVGDVKNNVVYGLAGEKIGIYDPNLPQEATVLKDVEYGDNQKGTLEVIALSGATATADNISVVNLTEQEVERVRNCATVSTVQKCFEDFKE